MSFPVNGQFVGQPNAQPVNQPGAQPQQQQPNAPTQSVQYPSGAPTPTQGIDPNGIIPYVPGVPAQFVGRKWGELFQFTNYAIRSRQQSQPAPAPAPVTPAQQSIAAAQPAPQQAAPAGQPFDPNAIASIVQEAVAQAQLPQQIMQTAQDFRTKYAAYQQHENAVVEIMRELPPEQQALPQVWENALIMVLGRQFLQNAAQQQPQSQQQGSGMFNQSALNNPGSMWAPSGQALFTEQPNSGSASAGASFTQAAHLSPAQLQIAQKLGISQQDLANVDPRQWAR